MFISAKDSAVVDRMSLNDNKAGMEGLDKARINQIIHEASKGISIFVLLYSSSGLSYESNKNIVCVSQDYRGVVGWCEGVMYLMSLGRPTGIGLQFGKACYPCSR